MRRGAKPEGGCHEDPATTYQRQCPAGYSHRQSPPQQCGYCLTEEDWLFLMFLSFFFFLAFAIVTVPSHSFTSELIDLQLGTCVPFKFIQNSSSFS